MRRLLSFACLGIAAFCAAYPLYVIRPFRHQGAGELQAALLVLQYRTIVEGVVSAATVIAFVSSRKKLEPAIFMLLVLLCAASTRINVYEQMFHPIGQPAFQPGSASKLDGAERVIAVRIATNARAYPIRAISYHHIVNDTLGSVPIVATY